MGQDISISGEILDVELNKLAGASVILTSRENHSQIAGGFSDEMANLSSLSISAIP